MTTLGCFVAAILFTQSPPQSQPPEPRRFALVVGANQGFASEPTLRFAVQDAHGVATVLKDLGGFAPENVITLENPTSDSLKSKLQRMREIVRSSTDRGNRTLFVLFYSGHADASSVHLGNVAVPWANLLKLTESIPATSRVVVADACRSGEVTLQKGLQHFAPFLAANSDDETLPSGIAVLASASAGESSQESPSLQGSFFTYHLIAGLRGSADFNGDGKVTLTEAFQYSADQTAASTVDTLTGVQHAMYRYQLRGYGDIVLTHVGDASDSQLITLREPAHYVFRSDSAAGPLVLMLQTTKRDQSVWLKVGTYYVQRRIPQRVRAGTVTVVLGRNFVLDGSQLEPMQLAQVTPKGDGDFAATNEDASALSRGDTAASIALWGGSGGPLLKAFAMPVHGALEYSRQHDALILDIQVAYDYDQARHLVPVDLNQFTAKLGVRGVFFESGPWCLSAGGRMGPGFVRETFPGSTMATNNQWFAELDLLARAHVHVSDVLFIGTEVAGALALPRTSSTYVRFTPVLSLGLGVIF